MRSTHDEEGTAEEDGCKLEKLDRRSGKGTKWGKKTGNTLKYCTRCFQTKTEQGVIEMPHLPHSPSLSLKKKGRWKIIDMVGQHKQPQTKTKRDIKGYVDFDCPLPRWWVRGPTNTTTKFPREPKWRKLKGPTYLCRPRPPRFAKLSRKQLKDETNISLSLPTDDEIYWQRSQEKRKVKKKKTKAKTRRSHRQQTNENENGVNEEYDEDDEENDDDLFVYVVRDYHSLEEDGSISSLHAYGGHYIHASIGQDPWSIGPYYESKIAGSPQQVVNVVLNNSKKQGRWCCCSNTTRSAIANQTLGRGNGYTFYEPPVLERRRIGSKKAEGARKKGRQYITVQQLLKESC
eukprot:TRINITY_DN9666_c0_g1_i1.p1 TRINITY_DN9666_c0_g1~~TRINITY_DN9666_c0_g1_i1.p1  ORF type:complete len:346 (+),score=56.84 TRINITY_DN9666_c0_g1_i1:25-1062(+)